MRGPEPVLCPLCGALVGERPTHDAAEIRALAAHFSTACPARTAG